MKRIIKTYEHFFPAYDESDAVKPNPEADKRRIESFMDALEQGDIDAVRFDSGDEKKLAALVGALGHGRNDLINPEWGKRYLDKGPIYVITSKYYYQPSNNIVVDGETNRRISVNDLIDMVA